MDREEKELTPHEKEEKYRKAISVPLQELLVVVVADKLPVVVPESNVPVLVLLLAELGRSLQEYLDFCHVLTLSMKTFCITGACCSNFPWPTASCCIRPGSPSVRP